MLVALPLICELSVLGFLSYFLWQAETEIRKERHARAVVTESQMLLKNFLDCFVYLYEVGRLRDRAALDHFDQLYAKIPSRIHSLKIALRDNNEQKSQLEELERIEMVASTGIELLGKCRRMVEAGGTLMELSETRKQLSVLGTQLLNDIQQFASAQERSFRTHADTEARMRFMVVQSIAVGVMASICLAIGLTVFFNQGTARRFKVLMDNTSKLAKGQELSPPIPGGDEIAHLDGFFHEMADALADAARRKQELMSMVSHDLRTPLTSMQGSLTMLQSGILGEIPDRAGKEVARAERNASRLINLINDLLDIEKLEAGRMEIARKDTPLMPVFEQSVEAVAHFASTHEVALDVVPTELKVLGDRDRLIQVTINLMSNAVKFSPRGSAVTVTAEESGDMVEVRVADRGRGVPQEFKESIFERFKQVAAEDATEKKGTGLGLPICKLIVESHGGQIGVRDNDGQGSIFWFRIPRPMLLD